MRWGSWEYDLPSSQANERAVTQPPDIKISDAAKDLLVNIETVLADPQTRQNYNYAQIMLHDALNAAAAEGRRLEQILVRTDLHYLGSILKSLSKYKSIEQDDIEDRGFQVGDEVLSDNLDWLSCYIDKHERALANTPASSPWQAIETAPNKPAGGDEDAKT